MNASVRFWLGITLCGFCTWAKSSTQESHEWCVTQLDAAIESNPDLLRALEQLTGKSIAELRRLPTVIRDYEPGSRGPKESLKNWLVREFKLRGQGPQAMRGTLTAQRVNSVRDVLDGTANGFIYSTLENEVRYYFRQNVPRIWLVPGLQTQFLARPIIWLQYYFSGDIRDVVAVFLEEEREELGIKTFQDIAQMDASQIQRWFRLFRAKAESGAENVAEFKKVVRSAFADNGVNLNEV